MAVKEIKTKGKALAEDEIIYEEDLRAQKPKGVNLDDFITKYKNIILGVVAVIVVGSVGYFFYNSQQAKKNIEAQDAILPAIKYFEADSFALAAGGDGVNPGFEGIIEDFGGTKTGNLARFYLGVCYMNMSPSKPAEAIEQLEKYDLKSDLQSAVVLGALGSAYEETGEYEKAAKAFEEAAATPEKNVQTTPYFLKQSARNYESADKNDKALKLYQEIKRKYPTSEEGQDVDRYIAKYSARMKTSKRGSAHSLSENSYSGNGDHSDKVVGIVVARWNAAITEKLFLGAQKTLKAAGLKAKNIIRVNVPGSFELPFGAQALIDKIHVKNDALPDAVICIGCVIQGETRHFDFISQAVADGVMRVGLDSGIPVIFGVLTPDNPQQAEDRAGGKFGNKGTEAAIAALELMDVFGN